MFPVSHFGLRCWASPQRPDSIIAISCYLSIRSYRRGRIYRVGLSSGRSSSTLVGRPSISARTGRAEIRLISSSSHSTKSIAHLKKSGRLQSLPRHTLVSHKRPDACQGTGVGEVTAPPAAPQNRCSDGCPHNLVSGGGVGITLPLSAAHSTEDPDDSPPLGQLDRAGSPSSSVSRLPVPGSLEFCRSPSPCIDALPATSITLHASPKKRTYGQKCQISLDSTA
jgi:hypothetical protein